MLAFVMFLALTPSPFCPCEGQCDCGPGCRCCQTAFAPVKPEVPKAARYPDIEIDSNWGAIHLDRQTGNIVIEGHPQSVFILWTFKRTGEPCPGVYKVKDDNTLEGIWGWSSSVNLNPDGTLTGQTIPDAIFKP
jgi:hypothetical protein